MLDYGLHQLATSHSGPYDLVYLDRSPNRKDVMIDSILAWLLLNRTAS